MLQCFYAPFSSSSSLLSNDIVLCTVPVHAVKLIPHALNFLHMDLKQLVYLLLHGHPVDIAP